MKPSQSPPELGDHRTLGAMHGVIQKNPPLYNRCRSSKQH